MTDYQQRGETFSVLGSKYDLFEGIYGPADWKRLCQFLELDRTPICCAIPKNHPLCDHKQISMHDLDNQHIVTIPLDTDLTLPYGLMYANEPSEALKKFLRIVKKTDMVKLSAFLISSCNVYLFIFICKFFHDLKHNNCSDQCCNHV